MRRCYRCNKLLIESRERVDYRWGGDLIAIVEGVPTWMCGSCGERYYDAPVIRRLEEIALRSGYEKKITVPVCTFEAKARVGPPKRSGSPEEAQGG
ncbi:MAG: YgiT-type zinc finger protein [bacterium]